MVDLAKAEGIDVIVVGSVGMSGRKEFLLENVPNRVSHNAHCTVVIVQTHLDGANR
jgi:ubiquinone biosynthesis protein